MFISSCGSAFDVELIGLDLLTEDLMIWINAAGMRKVRNQETTTTTTTTYVTTAEGGGGTTVEDRGGAEYKSTSGSIPACRRKASEDTAVPA